MAPNGKTCIVIEIPYDTNNPNMADKHSAKSIISLLSDRGLINISDVSGSKIIDVPYAYPIITSNVNSGFHKLSKLTESFQNLQITGRSAGFQYLHIHDLFERAKNIIERCDFS